MSFIKVCICVPESFRYSCLLLGCLFTRNLNLFDECFPYKVIYSQIEVTFIFIPKLK